ncbi:hypothetical protein TDB9533_02911 [Thalassocella blandensis]|nr:hypothetical protein TDB9533_02911 [Thalassocella blandensis]
MYKAFLLSVTEWLKFGIRLLRATPYAGALAFIPRLLLFTVIWLISGSLTLFHWLGFLLDECLFFSYRQTTIERPLFIIGIPRSGTTWLQRVLAQDANTTSLTLWECIFAPSITQRYIFKGLSTVLQPVVKLSSLLMRGMFKISRLSFFKNFDNIHKLGLSEPEEDFLLLLPVHACFLMALLCPREKHYWNLAKFDDAVAPYKRDIILQFYSSCVRKHLYFHNRIKGFTNQDSHHLRFLSKNPSFTPFLSSLRQHFPDAHFIVCIREPEATIPSQISSLMPVAKLLGMSNLKPEFISGIVDLLKHYYALLERNASSDDITLVNNHELHCELKQIVTRIYKRQGLVLSESYLQHLEKLDQRGKKFRSQHHYQSAENDALYHDELPYFSASWQKLNATHTVNK